MDLYRGTIPVLRGDRPDNDFLYPPGALFGLKPRDRTKDPPAMFASPPREMVTIDESEWDARYDEAEATKSSLEHIYLSGPNGTPAFEHLGQSAPNCWAFSVAHAVMLDRLRRNLPHVRFAADATSAVINNFDGAWCGTAANVARTIGQAPAGNGPGLWPEGQANRSFDTPELRANMARYRVEEEWVDLTLPVYGQQLNKWQLQTALFNNLPCPVDFGWWAHSVLALRHVRIERGSWGLLILNQWPGHNGEGSWGRYGLAVLEGVLAVPMDCLAIRLTSASAAPALAV